MHPRRLQALAAKNGELPVKGAADWVFYGYLLVLALEYTGLLNSYPFLKQLRFTTLLSYSLFLVTLSQVGFRDLFKHPQTKALLALLAFTILSVLWAVVSMHALESIRPFVDYLVFFYLTLSLVDRVRRFEVFSWTLLAISIYLVSQNLSRLGQEVRAGSYAASYFMGDGNDFAWGLAVMLPFAMYLLFVKKSFIARMIALGAIGSIIIGIMGTGSRGGTLGVVAAALFYWWFISKSKGAGVALMVAGLVGVLLFAPSTYMNRMGTLANTSEDTSAQSRLATWKASTKMAIHYPLGVGAGNFASVYGRYYLGGSNLGYAQNKWYSAHSIYFRTLGEYGYVGLGLLLWLIVGSVRDGLRTRARLIALGDKAPYPIAWANQVSMAMVACAVCGIFLGGLTYPHLFMLCGLTVASKRLAGLGFDTGKAPVRRRGSVTPTQAAAKANERKA